MMIVSQVLGTSSEHLDSVYMLGLSGFGDRTFRYQLEALSIHRIHRVRTCVPGLNNSADVQAYLTDSNC